ncbi:hypothetical protein ATF69_3469 [Acidovorax delafieldii]|uniref:Uncharacterized protein n=1 Tax=Acidovorax delafieldii TaxID=47920 RepID=A0A561XIE2_ACIDE|nr:hypothetical protein [Acidovorax delafieldii]TWG35901.1 hypothetical protein ATF69_3469 [Acidovorax delafieldii]
MERAALSVAGIATYAAIAVATYWIYIRLFKVDVVFYAAIWACTLALLAYALLITITPFSNYFNPLEKVQNIAICGLLGYILAITFPTIIDRSLSFYFLEKIQQRGGGIQLNYLDYIFREEYIKEHRLMEVRLTEQMESGTLFVDQGSCIRLTTRGELLATFSRFFRSHFLPPQRLIAGEYSSDLVDPFMHKNTVPDYLCKQ